MNGPQHYREAERLLELAGDLAVILTLPERATHGDMERARKRLESATGVDRGLIVVAETVKVDASGLLAAAQVHATLAAAAPANGISE